MSKIADKVRAFVDRIMGKPSAMPVHHAFTRPNRKQRRTNAAVALKAKAEPIRRKFEKRGAPGRSSKGRKPLRVQGRLSS